MIQDFFIRLFNQLHRDPGPTPEGKDLILGVGSTETSKRAVIWREADRPMHLAIIGLSGVGKSYLLENLIRQDIQHGTGFVLFDVHGDLADNVVAFLAEQTGKDRDLAHKVVIIEPFDPAASVGFNPLEQAESTSAYSQAQELAHVLRMHWETKRFGPRSEELLRHSLYTLAVNNLTLLELPALLTITSFREKLLKSVSDSAVLDYWRGRYESLSDGMQVVVREPLLTRVSAFLSDPQIREIVGQQKSTFSFRDALKKALWVVVNLSKGKLGDENSSVLGSLFFTKLKLDVMAQAKVPEKDRRLFAVYADELQNLVGANILTLIAEARKYRVSLTTGQQFWSQLPPHMRAAVLGMGAHLFFRLHYHDASELSGELHPSRRQYYTEILTRLPNREAIFRSGTRDPIPTSVKSHKHTESKVRSIELLRVHSRTLYTKPRQEIRRDIAQRIRREESKSLDEILRSIDNSYEEMP
jgi:hypothetical protein